MIKLHKNFNEKCLKVKLFPKYTYTKTHDTAERCENYVFECGSSLVQRQVRQQTEDLICIAEHCDKTKEEN